MYKAQKNNSFVTKSLMAASLSLLGVIGFANHASAADGKVYPGSNCHYGALTPSSNVKYDSTGFIYNNSTTHSALISCPIAKDSVFDRDAVSTRIRYRKATNVGLNCTIHSRFSSGTSGVQKSKWDFGFAGVKWMTLDDVAAKSAGSLTLSCILPPSKSPVSNAANRAGIYNYLVTEK